MNISHINKNINKTYQLLINSYNRVNHFNNEQTEEIVIRNHSLYGHIASLFFSQTLYSLSNRYLYVLPVVTFFCLWRNRLVSFHICKASRRSSKFCLPVADLHFSSFFFPRSTTPRSCLSRSSFSSSSSSAFIELSLPCRTYLYLLFFLIYSGRRKLAEKEQKIWRKSTWLLFLLTFLFSAFSILSLFFSQILLRTDFLDVCATRTDSFAWERSLLLRTNTFNGYLPNYFGVGFLWVPEKSLWAKRRISGKSQEF